MFFKYTELFEEYFYLCVIVREVFLHVLYKNVKDKLKALYAQGHIDFKLTLNYDITNSMHV